MKQDLNRLKGGFVGSTMMNCVLAENGMVDKAYDLLLYEGFPGWLYAVNLGATTIWERWNSVLPDGTISGTQMNSLNHYSYGSVVEFLYRYAAGIVPTAPGFKKARIAPCPEIRLGHMECSYDSVSGKYVSNWRIEDDGSLSFYIEIPFGCEAEVILPEQESKILEAGSYDFHIRTDKDYRALYSADTPYERLFADERAVEILKKYVPCNHCHGTGAEGDGGSETCPTCKGSGSVIRNQQTILGTMQTRTTCPTCNGEGKIIKNKCKECGGDGIVYGEEVVTVKIPAGVAEGMQLSMGGKGNAGKHNGVPGDLLILVEEEPHPDLIRDENDLIYNLLLSFPTAALGGAVEIPTIDGKVKVKIDSGTQPGKVLRLRGKGLPNVNGYGTGDLLVNISIYVPEALNKEEKSTLEKMEASDNFKPSTSVKEKIFKKFKSFFD